MTALLVNLKALYGFSRGTQATLSVAQPLTVVLLASENVSPWRFAAMTLAALTGFFAVFAANDLLDVRLDRRGFDHLRPHDGPDIDSAGGRHPLARGKLSTGPAVLWVTGLGLVAVAVCAMLSWVCVVLFLAAAALEGVYCLLATVTCYKTLLSGIMVATGACAGWFAVTSEIDPLRLGLVVLWMAAWEIGGRNIPNDLADVDEDTPLGIRTLPVVHGARAAAVWACAALVLSAAAGTGLLLFSFPALGVGAAGAVLGVTGAVAASGYTLIAPGVRLLRQPDAATALAVFNRATFHPVLVLAAVAAGLAVG